MEWFDPLPNTSPISKLTPIGTTYTEYRYKDVLLVEQKQLQGSYLLQVGIPHRVKNFLKPRYCLCFVLSDLNNQRLSMSEAQLSLKPYLE